MRTRDVGLVTLRLLVPFADFSRDIPTAPSRFGSYSLTCSIGFLPGIAAIVLVSMRLRRKIIIHTTTTPSYCVQVIYNGTPPLDRPPPHASQNRPNCVWPWEASGGGSGLSTHRFAQGRGAHCILHPESLANQQQGRGRGKTGKNPSVLCTLLSVILQQSVDCSECSSSQCSNSSCFHLLLVKRRALDYRGQYCCKRYKYNMLYSVA